VKRAFPLLVVVLLLTGTFAARAEDRSKKEEYELQERCGKRAEELFRRDWGNSGIVKGKDSTTTANFENHYNTKLNKCFEKLETIVIPHQARSFDSITTRHIFDVNEQRTYAILMYSYRSAGGGGFHILTCDVAGKSCDSEKEWQAMASHYMDE
jgi:hypothetical protein